jgi:hypothetical protein
MAFVAVCSDITFKPRFVKIGQLVQKIVRGRRQTAGLPDGLSSFSGEKIG